MPSWLGGWEIAIIVVIILLIFGGRLIPRLGSSLGRSIKGLKTGLKEGEEEFKTAIKEEDLADSEPGDSMDRTSADTRKSKED